MKRFLIGNFSLILLAMLALNASAALFDQRKPADDTPLDLAKAYELNYEMNKNTECAYPNQACLIGREDWRVLPGVGEMGKDLKEDDWAPRMSIVNRAFVLKNGAKEHKVAFKGVEKYLEKDPIQNKVTGIINYKDNAQDLARAFDDCLDYGCTTAYNFTNITYPNTDKAKAQVTLDGQDVCGTPSVRVWAKKGDNIIQLSAELNQYMLEMDEQCAITSAGGGDPEVPYGEYLQCCVKYVKGNTKLIQEAEEKAQQLIKTFAISN